MSAIGLFCVRRRGTAILLRSITFGLHLSLPGRPGARLIATQFARIHRERRVDDNLKGAHGAPEPDRQAPAAEHRLVPERGQRAAGELPHRPEVDAEGRPVEVVPAVRHAAEAADARVLVGGLAEPVAAHRRLGPEASSQRGPGGGAEASGHTGVWRGAREQVEVPGKG